MDNKLGERKSALRSKNKVAIKSNIHNTTDIILLNCEIFMPLSRIMNSILNTHKENDHKKPKIIKTKQFQQLSLSFISCKYKILISW